MVNMFLYVAAVQQQAVECMMFKVVWVGGMGLQEGFREKEHRRDISARQVDFTFMTNDSDTNML